MIKRQSPHHPSNFQHLHEGSLYQIKALTCNSDGPATTATQKRILALGSDIKS